MLSGIRHFFSYSKKVSFVLSWACFLMLFESTAFGQNVTSQFATREQVYPDQVYVKNYLQRISEETGAPGVSAAVAVNGRIIYSGGTGFSDLDNKALQDGKTVHNIGSISKAYAVVAIMQLVEKGLINLDDEIQEYLPYMPRKQKPITVNHILTHTSGIRHYTKKDQENHGFKRMRHYNDYEESTTIFRDDSLLFDPGSYYSYSSFSSALMHGIVEKVSGLGFEDYLEKNIWLPAGMLNTCFDVPSRIIPKRGKGYVRNSKGVLINAPYEDVSYKYASGGIISTPEDMVKFALALNNGMLLKPKTLGLMYKPQFDKNKKAFNANLLDQKEPLGQGLIWWSGQDNYGRTWYGHSGSVKGTNSFLMNFPKEKVVVAIQFNTYVSNVTEYALALAEMFLLESGVQGNK
ncbi:serine hydrolase domain-containing protein [Pontibacter harenae]|uniref:serine hydrolase domain-containing protein n=1 Tax=Pontibacter harenae TaxID=2894083 RepID=UPI001E5ED09D|nr:serine hydrolase domain-containing protein [Pontibacter harenae]MCC9169021.1 beta-lactamase family protein [Pontibacter harenae]